MPKITNWTTNTEGEFWTNDKTGDHLYVSEIKGDSGYQVLLEDSESGRKDSAKGTAVYNTKSRARDVAVEWMRNHPYAGKDVQPEINVDDLSPRVVDCESRHYDFSEGYPSNWEVAISQTEEERMNERWMPMMNTLWCLPDNFEIPDDVKQKLDNMTIVRIKEDGDYRGTLYLALTGGGMDMSWQIARTYVNLGLLPPASLGTLPNMANIDPSKPDNRRIVEALKKSHEINKGTSEHAISSLDKMVD